MEEIDFNLLDDATMADPFPNQAWKIFRCCSKLDRKQQKKLDQLLQLEPGNLGCRLALLSLYSRDQWKNSNNRARFCELLGWFIEHYPTSFITAITGCDDFEHKDFLRLRRKWLKQVRVNDGNLIVLEHAARFCAQQDEARAENLLKHGEQIDTSPYWSFQLLKLYIKKFDSARTKKIAKENALRSWDEFVRRAAKDGVPDSISCAEIEKIQKVLRVEFASLEVFPSRP